MRKMILVRGPSGAGKSHFIKNIGLDAYGISADKVRATLFGPSYNTSGCETINNLSNDIVWREVEQIIENRMSSGELILFEGLFSHQDSYKSILNKIEKYNYKALIVDFHGISWEKVKDNNTHRKNDISHIRESTLERIFQKIQTNKAPSHIPTLKGYDKNIQEETQNWLSIPCPDLSHWKQIVFIGDIQGCATVLKEALVKNNPENFYIFLGDLFDRGIENGEVMKFLLENFCQRDNAVLIMGNHDGHFQKWCETKSLKNCATEFSYYTIPDLKRAGFDHNDAKKLIQWGVDYIHFYYNNTRYICNHAGLSFIPQNPERISSSQMRRGIGHYNFPVDTVFTQKSIEHEESSGERVIQIHGHRNPEKLDFNETMRSFSLEESVEFGGFLRTMTLDENGLKMQKHRNTIFETGANNFKKKVEYSPNKEEEKSHSPQWLNEESAIIPASPEFIDMLENTPEDIIVKRLDHGVSSYNFARDVFQNARWNDTTEVARGFFMNPKTGEIVARSYTKGFSINEFNHPEMEIETLCASITGPVVCYIKENGYLGITGYNSITNRLFVASKSTNVGKFAEHFYALLKKNLKTEFEYERFTRLMEQWGCSALFEVVDPIEDPHIVDETEVRLVLLDIVRRSPELCKIDYTLLTEVANNFNLEVKQRAMQFKNGAELMRFYRSVEHNMNWKFNGKFVEGMMIEEAKPNGKILAKWKSPYYVFWKRMRSYVKRIHKLRNQSQWKNREIQCSSEEPLVQEFHKYLMTLDNDALTLNITELRRGFEKQEKIILEQEPKEPSPTILDGLHKQIRLGKMTKDNALKILKEKNINIEKFKDHDIFKE